MGKYVEPEIYHDPQENKLNEFATNTSLSPISDLYKSRTCGRKVFWSILLTVCLFMCIVMMYSEIVDYFEATVETSVEHVFLPSVELPHVSICDTKGLNFTQMALDGLNDTEVFNQLRAPYPSPMLDTSHRNRLEKKLMDHMKNHSIQNINKFLAEYAYSCNATIQWQHTTSEMMDVPDVCGAAGISWLFHHIYYYNCYGIAPGNQTVPGIIGGRSLTIRKPADPERDRRLNGSNGFVMEFFPRSTPEDPKPLLLPYGANIYITITQEKINRLHELTWPKGKTLCDEKNYLGGSCHYNCLVNASVDVYQCEPIGSFLKGHEYCFPFGNDYGVDGALLRRTQNLSKACSSKCKAKCQSTLYHFSVTHLPFSEHSEEYQQGVSTVVFGYPALSYTLIQEHNAYSSITLLSNFGGQLGLWLGGSVITIFQSIFLCTVAYGRGR